MLAVPLPGTCRVRNSPADRVPSHGTDAFGSSHAVDLVPVDDRGRSAPWSWRALVSTERPDGFVGFGRDVLAPCDGTVVQVHDGEPDHEARRSQPALLGYALTQRERVRRGPPGIAGNHVVVALGDGGPFVLLAHLRRGSVRVAPGRPGRGGSGAGPVRQLGQQHRAARAPAGQRLHRLAAGPRGAVRPGPAGRVDLAAVGPGPGAGWPLGLTAQRNRRAMPG